MFAIATHPAPGRPNEDFVIATPDVVVIVDGAGIAHSGCSHGVAWYARRLGTHTIGALVANPAIPLVDALAEGITAVAADHTHTCDLRAAGTPCAAVGILRVGEQRVDALALSDVSIVVETLDGPQVVCDSSIETVNGAEPDVLAGLRLDTPEHKAALNQLVARQTATRNRPGGWWVAAADPHAACHAATATVDRVQVRRAAAFTDGATRPVDQMRLYDWPAYLDMLDKLGPAALIGHLRAVETSDPHGQRHPRTKRHDDATIAAFSARS